MRHPIVRLLQIETILDRKGAINVRISINDRHDKDKLDVTGS